MPVVVVGHQQKQKRLINILAPIHRLASYGHVRDLPPKDGSVDPDKVLI